MINYDNKKFKPIHNDNEGDVDPNTIFYYFQKDNIITGKYSGKYIREGQLMAVINDDGTLKMRYHHIDDKGEIKTGKCTSRPEIMANGKIKLYESWQWTCGNHASGSSIIIEV